MKNKKILIFDSGIGGLNVLYNLYTQNNACDYYYLCDSENAPYGNKNLDWLLNRVSEIFVREKVENYDAVVLACNTLSTTILPELQKRFQGVKIFGVFPKVECAKICKTLLFCTPNTSRSVYIMESKKAYKNLRVKPLENLATDIEQNWGSGADIDLKKHIKIEGGEYGVILLGCTHFSFVREKFQEIFHSSLIVDSFLGIDDHKQGRLTTTVKSGDFCSFENKIHFLGGNSQKNLQTFELLLRLRK